jgi:hypothetical protein
VQVFVFVSNYLVHALFSDDKTASARLKRLAGAMMEFDV